MRAVRAWLPTVLGGWCLSFAALAVCPSPDPALRTVDGSDTLVVLLHAYTADAGSMDAVRSTIDDERGAGRTDFLAPDLPFGLLSMARPADVLADLLLRLDCAWAARKDSGNPYADVVLVGHSMGALYARMLYVLAVARHQGQELDLHDDLRGRLEALGPEAPEARGEWATAVDRIVLLAGMNRGWSISHHMSLTRAVTMSVGVALGRLLSLAYGRDPIIFHLRRGAPFITQLRLLWLSMREQAARTGAGGALTVQLLGSIDDLVSPEDNIDLVTGGDFVYLEVSFSGHANVVQMDDAEHGQGRRDRLTDALTLRPGDLEEAGRATRRALRQYGLAEQAREEVEQVVFVIHGIRDEGYWTQRIAQRVIRKGLAKCGEKHPAKADTAEPQPCWPVETVTSSYGYFPMLSFLRPHARREKVEWLMDQYTQARAAYPRAEFSYVGHSHGTYLLARALRDYPAVRFERVVFAGSVVDRAYEWESMLASGRVKQVVNFLATADWVVAFFPKTLEMLGLQDLGAAGHDGFEVSAETPGIEKPRVRIVGGHGAALQEPMWEAIATFVVDGSLVMPGSVAVQEQAVWWVKYPAMVAPLVWVLIAAVLLLVLRWLWWLELAEWQRTLVLVGYGWLLWTVVTKV